MARHIFKHWQFLPTAFIVLGAVFPGMGPDIAAQTKTNVRKQESPPAASSAPTGEENKKPPDITRFFYEFTQPQFYVRHIVIEHDATGRGLIKFERLHDEMIYEEPLELSAAAWTRICGLWTALRFLESGENYQADKQFPHLGTMRLKMERDTLKRTAEFNWTNNKAASLLANEYRRAADQAILIFDISVARETQPLATPKLMDEIELQMKRSGLSDPQQLVPLLNDISTDEHLPLIARNHALRLIKKLEN
ncbi:MAG: hypothetical protein ACREA9_21570 [Pyrinomonadaceae bacterium]